MVALIVACSNREEPDYYEINWEYLSDESFKKQFVQIHDTTEIKLLNSILDIKCDNLENCPGIEYYYHREFHEEPCIVILIDDYYIREYAIWSDCMYIELSFEGGDGPYYSRGFSCVSNDSLTKYIIEKEYFIDEVADTTIANEYTIDTTIYITRMNGKVLPSFEIPMRRML